MALKNLFDMVKADRYTADGREAIIKAQEEETEDKVYQIGEISQKTGLQKTANGWVKPKSGKQPGAKKSAENHPPMVMPEGMSPAEFMKAWEDDAKKNGFKKGQGNEWREHLRNEAKKTAEYKPSRRVDPKKQPMVSNPNVLGMTANGAKKRFEALGGEFLENKNGVDIFKTRDGDLVEVHYGDNKKVLRTQTTPAEEAGSQPATEWKPDESAHLSHKDHVSLAKEVKSNSLPGSDWTAEEIAKEWKLGKADAEEVKKEFDNLRKGSSGSKPAEEKKEGRNFRSELEANPKGAYDFEKTVEKSIPLSAGDKEVLGNVKSFMREEGTDYKDALKSVATGLVNGNKLHGDWYPEKEKSLLKIAKAVGMDEEVKSYVKTMAKGYDFGYSEDAAPKTRQLTGDTRIRVRKA